MPGQHKRNHTEMASPPAVFSGKVIAITGGARGIGLATARYLIERGATLAISDILSDELDKTVASLRVEFPESEISGAVVNVRNADDVEKWLLSVKEVYGKLHGCMNGAGTKLFHLYETGGC